MSERFADVLKARRAELRLSLRDFALRAEMDPANVSRLERGKSAPPRDEFVLDRIVLALQWEGADEAIRLKDLATTENGMFPYDIAENESLKSALPLLMRTVRNQQLDDESIEKLIELIKNA
jgi:transcriptional regulator with XRE-family HTH domain